MKVKYIFSVIAGLISVAVIGYSLLAPLWGWPESDKIVSTGAIVVMILSAILTVFTGQKISQEYTPTGVLSTMNKDKWPEKDYEFPLVADDENDLDFGDSDSIGSQFHDEDLVEIDIEIKKGRYSK